MNQPFKKFVLAALFSGLSLASAAGLSQDTGWYAGFNLGQSTVKDFDCTGTTSCDDKDTAWSIFGGYQFNKNFGVELGYVDLGKATQSGVVPLFGSFSASFEVTGFEFSGVGTLPISERFSMYGKLGLFMWDLDVKGSSTLTGPVSLSEDGTDFTFGIGARYHFTKNLAVQLQWQRYNDIGDDATTGKYDVDVIGAGIVFRF
jgi:OOP family OmpA-OmpF porin